MEPNLQMKAGNSEGEAASRLLTVEVTCPECKKIRKEPDLNSRVSTLGDASLQEIYEATILQTKKRSIRILTLLPGNFNDEVQCQLSSVSLDDDPAFTALSYCWGNASLRRYINVNGQEVSVTESLETALQYMRHGENRIPVWADAICINQSDRDEKSVQVAMMGEIYAHASLVWIWLGKPADNSDVAMDFIRKAPELDLGDPSYHLDPIAWLAVKALLKRPWWGRLWVVQEALLSKKATLNCGFQIADLQCMVRLKELETELLTAPSSSRMKPKRSSLAAPFGLLLLRWNDIKALMAKGHATLKEMIDATGETKCSLPVDKIYGIMSICNVQDRQNIPIDYKCCTTCLVLKVAKYNFRKFEMFGPLAVLQTHQVNKDSTLPSWVPDYVKYDYEDHFIFPTSKECTPFKAAADNAAWVSLGLAAFPDMTWFFQSAAPAKNLKVLQEHVGLQNVAAQIFPQIASLNSMGLVLEDEGTYNTLVLTGLIVDMVSTVYLMPPMPLYTGLDLQVDEETKKARRETMISECKKWRDYIRSEMSISSNPYETILGREEAFWRTLIADRDILWRGPPAEDFASRFEAWLGNGEMANDEDYVQPYGDAAVVHCMHRSFITTKKGYFGLGRSQTRLGDIVCILRGGSVPFTLRPREDGYYEFIGETYLHGVMDGNFVRNARAEDVKEFKIR